MTDPLQALAATQDMPSARVASNGHPAGGFPWHGLALELEGLEHRRAAALFGNFAMTV